MHLLLIAPSSPPKNSPEALQVRRFLETLDPEVRVTLVTTPVVQGWQWYDPTLEISRPGLEVISVRLPLHRITQRILGNHRLSRFHVPDSDFWVRYMTRTVLRQLNSAPDVIYSRSTPFSAALLARRLKQELHKPWMMHLSDPWVGSPYRVMSPLRAKRDMALEAGCFSDADTISLTTEGQADYYRVRYPERASDIIVTHNMMPQASTLESAASAGHSVRNPSDPIKVIHIGALYGERDPAGIIEAMKIVAKKVPDLSAKLAVTFVGNMPDEMSSLIEATVGCYRSPPVTFEEASWRKREADVLLSIEPEAKNELYKHNLLSKVVDYLSSGKPILALTPQGSVTAGYCMRGYGWSFEPWDVPGIARFLEWLIAMGEVSLSVGVPPPRELLPDVVTKGVECHLRKMNCSLPGMGCRDEG